ncbi:uncharacterized protein LOC135928495 [Gordionus sp. m RMFG-2023]|uniref:uncharacterized protein LOC135928495 n=1 Tax=Gordionus sp. m RMFG-2023 TaxID=3053472 RepID=UPI0031FD683E
MQNGNNDHRDEICQNFLASYENSEIKNDIDESERKRLENECEILKIKLQEFERLKQKRIDLEAESRDLNVYREQCRNHLTHLIDNQSEKIAITNTLKSKLEKEEIEHRALIAKLNTQKFSKKDMKIIQDKKFQLGNDIESIGKEILQLEKNKAIQDDQLNTLTEKVNASCIITNTRMMELELYNCKYELRAHQLTPEKLEEMQVFLRGTVENARQTVSSVRTLLEKESETLEQLKKDIVSKLNSISYLEASIKSADFDLKAKNEECEAKCTATVNQKREICEELRTLTEEFNKVQMKISLAEKVVQAHKLRICEEDEQYQEQDKYFEEVFKTDMEHFLKAQKTVKDAYEATQMRIDKFIAEQSEDDEEN